MSIYKSPQYFPGIHELLQFTEYLLCVCFTWLDGSVSKVEKQPYPPGEIGPTNVCQSSLCGTVQVGVGWFAVGKMGWGLYTEEGPG